MNVDWLDKPYYSLNAYFKHVYGQKIYKIAVNAGLTCPNRDGTLDNRGCIFCSAGGSGDFAVDIGNEVYHREYAGREGVNRRVLDVSRQIERGMAKFNKSVGEKFVIYFQAYTNTYGDAEYLREIWTAALMHESVVGISIATRPDCLSDEALDVLAELNGKYCSEDSDLQQRKFIWIELGLQTMHEKTAGYIRRHYPLAVYEEAVKRLGDIEIPYITHIILGLPGETEEMMLETVRYVNRGVYGVRPQGIKLQLLHVLDGTDLANDYNAGEFEVLTQDAYIDLVIRCLQNISEDVVIHRVTGDGPKSILIAPKWSSNKRGVLNSFHSRMRELGARQGDSA